jgi:RHS repeat-associated protein
MTTSSGGMNLATTGSDHLMPGPMPVMSNGPALTPAGVPVPTPYAYFAESSSATETEKCLVISGDPVLVIGSSMNIKTPGNAPSKATGGDVVTFAACGCANMFTGATDLVVGGHGVCATNDHGYMNTAAPQSKVTQCVGTLLEGAMVRAAGGALKMFAAKELGVIDPVSVSSGHVLDRDVDLRIPGLIGLEWTRLYSSGRCEERTPLGRGGWTHGFHQWIEVDRDQAILHDEDGRQTYLPHAAPGASTFHRGKRLLLSSRSEGAFDLFQLDSRLTRVFRAVERGGRARLQAIRDAWGNTVELVYDQDNLVRVAGTSGRELRIFHDASSRISRVEAWSGGAAYQAVSYTYSRFGDLESATDAAGNVTRYEYDGLHRMVKKTLPNGVSFHYVHDEMGRCVRGWGDGGVHAGDLHYDVENGITTLSGNPSPRIFHWDERGAVTLEKTTDGTVAKKTTYDDDLLVIALENAAGDQDSFEYDARGNLITLVSSAGETTRREFTNDLLVKRIDPSGATSEYAYTAEGALAAVRYPSGRGLSLSYDGRGRVSAVYDGDGLHASFEYDDQDNVVCEIGKFGDRTSYGYDAAGRVISVLDPLGRTLRYTFDALGRESMRQYPDGSSAQRAYDSLGNVRAERDPLGGVTASEHGGTHSLLRTTFQDGTTWELTVDGLERVRSIKNPKQETWSFRYDRAGRVREQKSFDGRILRYRYAASGALSRIEHMDGTYRSFETDENGALAVERSPHGALIFVASEKKVEATVDEPPGKVVVTSEFDDLGRLVSETQDGLTIRHFYDEKGRRVVRVLPGGETTRYRYDASGFLIGVEHEGRMLSLVRDMIGNEVRRHVHTAAVDVLLTIDPMNRTSRQRVIAPRRAPGVPRTSLIERAYGYDVRGWPRAVEDSLRGTTTYEHDRIGQLVEMQRGGRRELIDYDVAGSVVGIRTDTATAVPWTVRPGNVLSRAGDVELEVDENRRRVRRIEAGGAVTQYVWDCRDRLREVRLPDGTRAHYTYDVHGRRLRKDIVPPAVTTLEEAQVPVRSIRYVWDGTVLAAEIDSERGTRVFVHHPGTFVPMLQQEQGEVFTYVTDPLGTPKELIDERGDIAWAATHSAWGSLVEQTAVGGARRSRPVASPFRLLGQYHDEETGLSYTLMRYFDAETARWLSPDPLEHRSA